MQKVDQGLDIAAIVLNDRGKFLTVGIGNAEAFNPEVAHMEVVVDRVDQPIDPQCILTICLHGGESRGSFSARQAIARPPPSPTPWQ